MATIQTNAASQGKGMTGKQKAAAAAAAAAKSHGKGKGDASKAEAKEPKATALVIPKVNSKALSTDLGPKIAFALNKSEQDENRADELKQSAKVARNSALAELCTAIVKAAKGDADIGNTLHIAAEKDPDKKQTEILNNRLNIALGIRTVVMVPSKKEGEPDVPRLQYSDAVAELFPKPGVDKDSPEGKARAGARSNWVKYLQMAARVALDVIERKHTATIDRETGILRLSGPEIKKQFGMDSVVLDQKQTVQPVDKHGKATKDPVELKEKPSYTAIAAKAGERHGKVISRVSNTRGANARALQGLKGDNESNFVDLCKMVVQAIEAIKGEPTPKMVEAMKGVASAIGPLI